MAIPSILLISMMAFGSVSTKSIAAPTTPTYSATFEDAVTGDNEFLIGGGKHRWFVDDATDPDGLADSYNDDLYERPSADTFDNNVKAKSIVDAIRSADVVINKLYSATYEYYGYLDITSAMFGFDNDFMYFRIVLFSKNNITEDGTVKDDFGSGTLYSVRISENSDGANGLLLQADGQANFGVSYQSSKTQGFLDSDGSVGGPGGIAATGEIGGDGFDDGVILSDGKLSANDKKLVLFSRIDKTSDMPVVEIAFDYKTYNSYHPGDAIDTNNINYLVFEANRGYKDNSVYLWNDKNTFSEAGSPYN